MLKRITAILLLIQFAGAMVSPLVHGNNCDMVCCTEESDSIIMKELAQDCKETMSECHPPVFLPVVNAPQPVHEMEADLSSFSLIDLEGVTHKIHTYTRASLVLNEHSPPGQNLPLLI